VIQLPRADNLASGSGDVSALHRPMGQSMIQVSWTREHDLTRSRMSPTAYGGSANLQQTIDDLQHQLAERTAERDEAPARETATAEVLGVINSSPGDLAPVWDAMLERATRLCGAAGILWTNDGRRFRAVAWRGMTPAFIERALELVGPGFDRIMPAPNPIEREAGNPTVVIKEDQRRFAPISARGPISDDGAQLAVPVAKEVCPDFEVVADNPLHRVAAAVEFGIDVFDLNPRVPRP
jgi:hypothetical protein